MGTYYIAVNHERREYIDPWHINDGGVKAGLCILRYPGLSNLVMHHMIFGGWSTGVRMVPDCTSEYDDACANYRNITLEAVHAFNGYASASHPSILLNPDP